MAGMKVQRSRRSYRGNRWHPYLATHIDERQRTAPLPESEQYEAAALSALQAYRDRLRRFDGLPLARAGKDASPARPYGLYFSDDRRGIGFAGHAVDCLLLSGGLRLRNTIAMNA
jgi:hypothetical protein